MKLKLRDGRDGVFVYLRVRNEVQRVGFPVPPFYTPVEGLEPPVLTFDVGLTNGLGSFFTTEPTRPRLEIN